MDALASQGLEWSRYPSNGSYDVEKASNLRAMASNLIANQYYHISVALSEVLLLASGAAPVNCACVNTRELLQLSETVSADPSSCVWNSLSEEKLTQMHGGGDILSAVANFW